MTVKSGHRKFQKMERRQKRISCPFPEYVSVLFPEPVPLPDIYAPERAVMQDNEENAQYGFEPIEHV